MRMRYVLLVVIASVVVLQMSPGLMAKDLTPQEVYDLKQKALKDLNFEEFCKYVSKDNLAGFKAAKDPKQLLFFIGSTTCPVEYEFIGEDINKDTAIVYLKGKKANPMSGGTVEEGFGKAQFVKEGTQWKYHREEWQKEPWKR